MGCAGSTGVSQQQQQVPNKRLVGTTSQHQAGEMPWKERRGDVLAGGRELREGQSLCSHNGLYKAVMQRDGDLVVYSEKGGGTRLFSSADCAGGYERARRDDWVARLSRNGSLEVSSGGEPPVFSTSVLGGYKTVEAQGRDSDSPWKVVMGDDGKLAVYYQGPGLVRTKTTNGGAFGTRVWDTGMAPARALVPPMSPDAVRPAAPPQSPPSQHSPADIPAEALT